MREYINQLEQFSVKSNLSEECFENLKKWIIETTGKGTILYKREELLDCSQCDPINENLKIKIREFIEYISENNCFN